MSSAAGMESRAVGRVLLMAFELGAKVWKLGFTTGGVQQPRCVQIGAGEIGALGEQIRRAKERFGLDCRAQVFSCYEAGRDGFWLHRYLTESGVINYLIDPASTPVDRRRRRAKTDRLDLRMLLRLLEQYVGGDEKVWRVVKVLSVEAEDARHLHRELEVLKKDRQAINNRLRSLLALIGVGLSVKQSMDFGKLRQWDGSEVPPWLRARLDLEHQRWLGLGEMIRQLQKQRDELMANDGSRGAAQARRLARLRSLGNELAWPLAQEGFANRDFRNRRQVAAYIGLTPTPFDSGESVREQGITKAGNVRMRWRMIEAAWLWIRLQPSSELTLWFQRRFGGGGKRSRRIGIVALARKLSIALWRYVEYGVVPEGATLKP